MTLTVIPNAQISGFNIMLIIIDDCLSTSSETNKKGSSSSAEAVLSMSVVINFPGCSVDISKLESIPTYFVLFTNSYTVVELLKYLKPSLVLTFRAKIAKQKLRRTSLAHSSVCF